MSTVSRGRKGEEIGLQYLEKKGYKLIRKNYYTRFGEIDLIVYDRKRDEIVFVEVKTRSNGSFGRPEEAVDERKMQKIHNSIEFYLAGCDYMGEFRVDCLSIELDYFARKAKIRHLENI